MKNQLNYRIFDAQALENTAIRESGWLFYYPFTKSIKDVISYLETLTKEKAKKPYEKKD